MLDLSALSGLPMQLDDAGQLHFEPDVEIEETRVRLLEELEPVALDPASCQANRAAAYYMWNGVRRREDAGRLAGLPLRYELTLLPPLRLGRECAKTFGHIHNAEPHSGRTYPEICEVLTGVAHFLFQTLDPRGPSADCALCVEVRAGQKLIFPSGLDHLTINAGTEPVLFSDVVALASRGLYDRFRATRGACYLLVDDGAGPHYVANPTYRAVPPLERLQARDYPEIALTTGRPLYTAFVQGRGEGWRFLTEPDCIELDLHSLQAAFKD